MIQAVSGEFANQGRVTNKSRGSGYTQWLTSFIGRGAGGKSADGKNRAQIENNPQAFLVEMDANSVIVPHFHQIDEFQVLVSGTGNLGRATTPLLALHYVDHHTAYGPINAGASGLSFFTIRAKSDPGAIYLHDVNHKEMLKPTKKRYLLADGITLNIASVLENRTVIALQNLFEGENGDDGLNAFILRMGAHTETTGPDPKATGGQYYLVVNGSLMLDGASYPAWSTIFLKPTDSPLAVAAGGQGLKLS